MIVSILHLVLILPTTRNTAYRLDDVLGDGHAGLELDHEGPPHGGAPGVEPPPSEVLATLTELGFVASHPLLVHFEIVLSGLLRFSAA